MKKLLLFMALAAVLQSNAQVADFLISMDGIGAIKLDMKQEDLEKVLNKKIPLTNPWDTVSGAWYDSAIVMHKKMELRIQFERTYTDEKTFYMRITGLQTRSSLCKTKSGIGIGSDKQKILTAYENSTIIMGPDGEEDGSISKTKYTIIIRETDIKRMLIFHLVNKKVDSMEVGIYFTDSE